MRTVKNIALFIPRLVALPFMLGAFYLCFPAVLILLVLFAILLNDSSFLEPPSPWELSRAWLWQ